MRCAPFCSSQLQGRSAAFSIVRIPPPSHARTVHNSAATMASLLFGESSPSQPPRSPRSPQSPRSLARSAQSAQSAYPHARRKDTRVRRSVARKPGAGVGGLRHPLQRGGPWAHCRDPRPREAERLSRSKGSIWVPVATRGGAGFWDHFFWGLKGNQRTGNHG